jgi:hypothetical protein
MWESQQRFPRAVGRVENLLLVFQAFHGPAFPQRSGRLFFFCLLGLLDAIAGNVQL